MTVPVIAGLGFEHDPFVSRSRTMAGAAAVALATAGNACGSKEAFTLELIVNDESALPLSVDRGEIEPANATFWRVLATWDSYEDALVHPGLGLSNGLSSLTVRVRDCRDLDPDSRWLGSIVRQVQSAAVAEQGAITLVTTAGWECTDSDGHSAGTIP